MSGANTRTSHDPPLRETLELVDPEKYYFGLELGPSSDSYEAIHSLTRDGGKPLVRWMELARAKWGLGVRDAALFAIGTYAWRVGGPAVACYVLSRRVPDISPENVALTFDGDGGVSEVALLQGGFAVLPSDPAADHPEAVVLDDEAEQLGWLHERFVAGVEPLIEAARGHVRLGHRAAWRWVSDYVASSFLTVGWDTGDQARYAIDAEGFVSAPPFPSRGGARFFVVEHNGRRGAYATRGVCCQAYKDPGHDNCDSCPMLTQDELERRALTDLASRG